MRLTPAIGILLLCSSCTASDSASGVDAVDANAPSLDVGVGETPDAALDSGIRDTGETPDAALDSGIRDTGETPDALPGLDVGVDGGSTVRPLNLVVTAGGEEIGWLQAAGTWILNIWDPRTGLAFSLNDSTGYVSADSFSGRDEPGGFYADAECREALAIALVLSQIDCSTLPPEPRRTVYGVGGDRSGFTEAEALFTAGTEWVPAPYFQADAEAECTERTDLTVYGCGAPYVRLSESELPTAFPLPIEVHER